MILGSTGKKLKVDDTSVPISKLLRAWLCFARTLLHGVNACLGPPACACKFRLHARARRNIVGVRRHASLVTSKIGLVKITHCDQQKRYVVISNILNQTNYSYERDAKRTSEYSVNSFEH